VVKGADVNVSDSKNGFTPLIIARAKGDIKMVNLLLKKGANINAKDKNGVTALGHATKDGMIQVRHVLITKGAKESLN